MKKLNSIPLLIIFVVGTGPMTLTAANSNLGSPHTLSRNPSMLLKLNPIPSFASSSLGATYNSTSRYRFCGLTDDEALEVIADDTAKDNHEIEQRKAVITQFISTLFTPEDVTLEKAITYLASGDWAFFNLMIKRSGICDDYTEEKIIIIFDRIVMAAHNLRLEKTRKNKDLAERLAAQNKILESTQRARSAGFKPRPICAQPRTVKFT